MNILKIDQPTNLITIYNKDNDIMITIHNDMTIEYGENYNPDETAIRFWESIYTNGKTIKELKEEIERLKEYKFMYEQLCK